MYNLRFLPKTASFDFSALISHCEKMSSDKGLAEHLMKVAQQEYSEPSHSVTERTVRAKSGDKHDYASMGTYWWPNPDTKDGLPYIRRDGITNHEIIQKVSFNSFFSSVLNLTLATLYSEDEKYAKKSGGKPASLVYRQRDKNESASEIFSVYTGYLRRTLYRNHRHTQLVHADRRRDLA